MTGISELAHLSKGASGRTNFRATRSSSSGKISHASNGPRCAENTVPSYEERSASRSSEYGECEHPPKYLSSLTLLLQFSRSPRADTQHTVPAKAGPKQQRRESS